MEPQAGATFGVLGALTIQSGDGSPIELRGERQRRLMGALLLHRDRPLNADALAELVWGDELPDDVPAAVQTHVSRLRRVLPPGALVTSDGGYRLDTTDGDVDVERFETLITHARQRRAEDPAIAVARLDDALALWRGAPYADFADWDTARREASRLEELAALATEERCDALIELGRHDDALALLRPFVVEHPLRERARSLLMLALYRAGRQPEALRSYEEYRRLLADELGLDPSPALRELEQAILEHLVEPAALPAPETAAMARVSLPRPATRLIGRDRELAEVVALLSRQRVVTLSGAAGVGKTRLAAEAALDHARAGIEIAVFCDLAPLRQGDDVPHAIASALGVEPRGDLPVRDRIVDVLRQRPALIVLDNCEHVIEAVSELVERLVNGTVQLVVLATSRERLAVSGETVYQVEPLDDDAAIELFVERAQAVRSAFRPTETDESDVLYICHRLDRLPLAIELAAARVQALSVREVADALSQRFRLLTGGRRTDERHRSLLEAVRWSFELLEPDERALCENVAVFADGFGVGSLAAFGGLDHVAAAELVSRLVERSLLVVSSSGSTSRYGMLETVRQYGLDRLRDRRELDAMLLRFARHMVDVAATLDAQLLADGHRSGDAMRRFEEEFANLRAAHALLVEHRDDSGVAAIDRVLYWFGFAAFRPEVYLWSEGSLDCTPSGSATRLDVLPSLCVGRWQRGDVDGAWAALREGLDTAEATHPAVRRLLTIKATLLGDSGLVADALAVTEQAFEASVAFGDAPQAAVNRFQRVLYLALAGDESAADQAEHDVAAAEASHGPTAAAWARYAAGEVLAGTDPDRARSHLERALELSAAHGFRFLAGVAGVTYASLEARHGDPCDAARAYVQLVDLWRLGALRPVESTMLRGVAELLEALGDHDASAVVQGAVATSSAAALFGPDAERQSALTAALVRHLGEPRYREELARGSQLDDDAVLELAAAALLRFV